MTCPILLLRLLFNAKQAEQPVQRRHIPCLWHKQYKRAFIKLRLPRLFCCDAAFAPLEYFRLLQQLIFRFHLCLPRLATIRKSDAPDDLADVFFLRFPLVLPWVRASVGNRKPKSPPCRLHRLHAVVKVFGVRFKVEITAGYADAASAVHIRIKSVGGIRITKALLRNAEHLPADYLYAFANCGADTSGITVKRELCIDLNGRTIAQERGENAYNVHAAVNVNIEGGTLTIRDSSEDKSGSIIGNTVAIVVAEGRCVLEGGSIASRGEYCDFGDGMVFAGAPVSLTEGGKGFLMTGGRISMAELEEGGMLVGDFYDAVGKSIEIIGGEVFKAKIGRASCRERV